MNGIMDMTAVIRDSITRTAWLGIEMLFIPSYLDTNSRYYRIVSTKPVYGLDWYRDAIHSIIRNSIMDMTARAANLNLTDITDVVTGNSGVSLM